MKSIYFNIIKLALFLTLGITNVSHSMDWNRWNPFYVDPLRLKLNGPAYSPYLNNDGTTIDPSIQILENIPKGERYGVCHTYAISKTIGLVGKVPETFPIVGQQDWYTDLNFLNDYCEKVTQPKKGDLIIYKSWRWGEILHTGIVYDYDQDLVESKWGINEHVLIHSTFSVPSYYGNYVEYHRPIKSNDHIIKDIKSKIDLLENSYLKSYFYPTMNIQKLNEQRKKWLLYNVAGEVTPDNNIKIATIENQLDWDMGLDLNITNEENQTPLIISAKHNNFDLTKLLITYKANINHQDQNGNTALIIAAKQNHLKTRLLLLDQKNCNKKLRDNEGNKASDYTFQQYPLLLSLKRAAKGIKDFGLL